jgi:hypothetical protein
MKKQKINLQSGSGHILLLAIIFIAILGALGFVGYSTWQKQNASANTADGGGGSKPKSLACKLLSISPKPALGVNSKYKVQFTTKNMTARISLSLSPGHTNADHTEYASGKPKQKYFLVDNETKTVTYNMTPPDTFKSTYKSAFGPAGKKFKTNYISRGISWSTMSTKYKQQLNCGGQNYF